MGKQRTGDEHIVFDGMPIGHLLSDYWAWNSSDLLINTERGSFSEFIVSSALDLDLSGTREDWGPYDVLFPYQWAQDGVERGAVHVEVKSAAYLQSWEQSKLSNIIFSIRPHGPGTRKLATAVRSSGNRMSTSSATIRRRTATGPTRWCWMTGTFTSFPPKNWMRYAALRKLSLSLLCNF